MPFSPPRLSATVRPSLYLGYVRRTARLTYNAAAVAHGAILARVPPGGTAIWFSSTLSWVVPATAAIAT
jgi:hypothetical protein